MKTVIVWSVLSIAMYFAIGLKASGVDDENTRLLIILGYPLIAGVVGGLISTGWSLRVSPAILPMVAIGMALILVLAQNRPPACTSPHCWTTRAFVAAHFAIYVIVPLAIGWLIGVFGRTMVNRIRSN